MRNLGDRDGVTLALRDAIRDGQVVGPNIVDAGTSISTTSGHMDPALGFRDDLRDALDRRVEFRVVECDLEGSSKAGLADRTSPREGSSSPAKPDLLRSAAAR